MEYRADEDQGFRRIWCHARVEYSETPSGRKRAERGFLTPGDAISWLCTFIDSRNDGGTMDGRLDVYLRPPGVPDAPPEVAVDLEVPEVSGTAEKGRGQLERLFWRYTRPLSAHIRVWYTERDRETGRDRRIARSKPLAHLLIEAAPDPSRPTVEVARRIERKTETLPRIGRAKCGADIGAGVTGEGDGGGEVRSAVLGSLRAAQEALRNGRDLCATCFAPR
jgi:hypothetical protein